MMTEYIEFMRLLEQAAEACVEYQIEGDRLFRRWMDAEQAAEKVGPRAGWDEYYAMRRAAREAARTARQTEAFR